MNYGIVKKNIHKFKEVNFSTPGTYELGSFEINPETPTATFDVLFKVKDNGSIVLETRVKGKLLSEWMPINDREPKNMEKDLRDFEKCFRGAVFELLKFREVADDGRLTPKTYKYLIFSKNMEFTHRQQMAR